MIFNIHSTKIDIFTFNEMLLKISPASSVPSWSNESYVKMAQKNCCINTGLILGVRPANDRRRYFVTTSLIGWMKASNQPWNSGGTSSMTLEYLVRIVNKTRQEILFKLSVSCDRVYV